MTTPADVIAGRARWSVEQADALAWLRDLPDACVDAVVTDPPYSSGGFTRGDRQNAPTVKYQQSGTRIDRGEFQGDSRDQRSYAYWCALWMSECLRVTKPGGAIAVFTDWRQLPSTTDGIQAGGWIFRGIVPWNKTESARPTPGRFRSQCEYVVWGSAGPMPLERDAPVMPGFFECRVDHINDKHHLTGKPTMLMREIVRIAERGGIVCDPFLGSGTTGVGAALEGFRFVGCEIAREHIATAEERIAAAHGEFVRRDATQAALPFDWPAARKGEGT